MAMPEMACSLDQSYNEIVVIHENHDFTLQVHEEDMTILPAPGQQRPIKRTVVLKVVKSVLQALKPIPGKRSNSYWELLFKGHMELLRENPRTASITVTSASSMVIIMRAAHKTVTAADYYVPTSEMWHLAELMDYCNISQEIMLEGFEGWWDRNPVEDHMRSYQERLGPTWYYQHTQGFLDVTKYIIYHAERVVFEWNPTELSRWHLYPPIMQQLNAARGRRRIILHNALLKDCPDLLGNDVRECCKKEFWSYFKSLVDMDVYPLETT